MANEEPTESAQEKDQQQQEPPAKKKRGANNQITKDDYDDDSDGDGDGDKRLKQGFKKASEETLKKRKIYKVKRPSSVPTGATTNGTSTASEDKPAATSGDAASSTTSSNPFASTNLSATSTTSTGNPFASTTLTATATESKTTTEENNSSPAKKRVFGFGAASGTNGNSGFGSGTVGGFAGVSGGFGSSSSTSGFGTSSLAGTSGSKTSTLGLGGFGSSLSSAAVATTTSGSPTKSLFGTTGASSIAFNFSSKTDSAAAGKGNENPANLPDTVELKTGEEDEEAIHSGRCKAFEWVEVAENDGGDSAENETVQDGASPSNSAINPSVQSSTQFQAAISTSDKKKDPSKKEGASSLDEDKWRELGIGPVKLLRSKSKHKRLRLVQRRESSKMGPATKVILNAPLWKESTCDRDRQAQQYLHLKTIKDGKMCQYLLKFKEVHDAGLFHHHVMDQIPLARPCFVQNEENTTAAKGTAAVEEKKD